MCQLDGIVGTEPLPSTVDAKQLSDRIAELAVGPLRIARTAFIYVTNSNALDVGLFQKVQHDAQSLRANSDESDVDLVTWRNVPGAAEHVPRNNCEGESCGGRLR